MAKMRKNQIAGQFLARPRQLVESPALRVLNLSAHLALMRIEVEHMSQGGAENGKLLITYKQFEEWGIHSRFVASALRELKALGLIEVTRRGYSGAAGTHAPNLYRLTYLQAWNASDTGTHEYLKITSLEQAEAIAAAARKSAEPRNVERAKNHFATLTKCEIPPALSEGTKAQVHPHKVGVLSHPHKVGVLSISRYPSPPNVTAPPPAGEAPSALSPLPIKPERPPRKRRGERVTRGR
jgi:hypothetical protein